MGTFNWSWINSYDTTNRASESVADSGGTLYNYRFATRGQINAAEMRSSFESTSTNINYLWRLWRSNIRPILDSLPSGKRDTRWRVGLGLPEKIDALRYGVQGSTLFVFNDANLTKASGRYWHSTDERPLTIAEAFENVWDAINDIEITSTTTPTSVDLDPLWYAIGDRYNGGTSVATSLDYRANIMEDWWAQLREDLYEPANYGPYTLGIPLAYSVANNIDLLLKAHGIPGGWQTNPAGLGHGSFAPGAHTHPYTQVTTTLTIGQTQSRGGSISTLADEVKRIRYELARTRGGAASWQTDPIDPVSGLADGDLYQHMNYNGSGTQTATNPHGVTSSDLGIDSYFQNIANYIGMNDYTSVEYPDYSSTNYISDDDTLVIAIGKLDDALDNVTGFVFKRTIDFTGRIGSDTELMQTPLVWEHNMGEHPVLSFIDLSAENQESYGMYSSQTIEVQVDYPDTNTVRIWTMAPNIRVIGLFGGTTGGPSSGITEYVRSIKAETGGVALYGDVTLVGGANITLTRSGQNITIAASGGGGGGYWVESGTALVPYVSTHSVQFGPGTPSVPGLSFSNDTDTGIYRSSDNVLSISTGGSRAIYFSTSVINCEHRLGISEGLYDSNNAASSWGAGHIHLSTNSTEWDNIETLIGSEGSIFAAILAASQQSLDDAYNNGYSITADTSPVTITSPNSSNNVALAIINNDTSNNPSALTIQNNTSGNGIYFSGSGLKSISSNGSLSINPIGVLALSSNTSYISFSDGFKTGWIGSLYLSNGNEDWTDFKYVFGEVSILEAIVAAASGGGGGSVSQPSQQIVYGTGGGVSSSGYFLFSSAIQQLTITKNNSETNWYDANASSIFLNGTSTQGSVISSDGNLTIGTNESGGVANALNLIARNSNSGAAYYPAINIEATPTAGNSPGLITLTSNYNGNSAGVISLKAYGAGGEGFPGGSIDMLAKADITSDQQHYIRMINRVNTTDYEFRLEEGLACFEGMPIQIENACYGTQTTASFASNTITANFATGKDMQTVEIDDDVTDLALTAPSGGAVKGMTIIISTDGGPFDIGGANDWADVYWETNGTNLAITPLEIASGDYVMLTLAYDGTHWFGWASEFNPPD